MCQARGIQQWAGRAEIHARTAHRKRPRCIDTTYAGERELIGQEKPLRLMKHELRSEGRESGSSREVGEPSGRKEQDVQRPWVGGIVGLGRTCKSLEMGQWTERRLSWAAVVGLEGLAEGGQHLILSSNIVPLQPGQHVALSPKCVHCGVCA